MVKRQVKCNIFCYSSYLLDSLACSNMKLEKHLFISCYFSSTSFKKNQLLTWVIGVIAVENDYCLLPSKPLPKNWNKTKRGALTYSETRLVIDVFQGQVWPAVCGACECEGGALVLHLCSHQWTQQRLRLKRTVHYYNWWTVSCCFMWIFNKPFKLLLPFVEKVQINQHQEIRNAKKF